MKQRNEWRLLALVLAICLLAGCTATGLPGETEAPTEAAETEALPADTGAAIQPEETESSTEEAAEEPAPTEPQLGEPEGWEEEWPEEYPVTNYRLLDGAFTQSGELNKYRYAQLPEAANYVDTIADAVALAVGCAREELNVYSDSEHDGYANWTIEAPNGNAWVSGSDITGRFTYRVDPGFDRILTVLDQPLSDPAGMQQAAFDFANRFSGITGELTLASSGETTCYYHDERSEEWRDVEVPAMRYIFSSTSSRVSLPLNDSESVPITCGDSEIEDLTLHCFTVTVWSDGTVVGADNYITRAEIVPDGTMRMPDESDMAQLMRYMSSFAENDTIVIERVRAEQYSVYFGYADIEPTVTVDYYFESNPDNRQSTLFVLPGLLE